MALSKEELAELEALEKEEAAAAEKAADELARQRLDAKRMRKRLAAKFGEHGKDFLVVMTTAGNFAIRRAADVELDALGDAAEDRGAQEAYLAGIMIEPPKEEAQRMLATYPGLINALIPRSFELVGKLREEEAKK